MSEVSVRPFDARHHACAHEGAQATELFAQAVAAYRSALEVRTREQLPQDWAATQNNLRHPDLPWN